MPEGGAPFGEAFFARVLPGMVKGCPCGEANEPVVRVHLVDGTAIELAQVVALAERFGVFAVFEGAGADGVERTADDVGLEALPYELVARVSVRSERPSGSRMGFTLEPHPEHAQIARSAKDTGTSERGLAPPPAAPLEPS